jgi:hypothetical protein
MSYSCSIGMPAGMQAPTPRVKEDDVVSPTGTTHVLHVAFRGSRGLNRQVIAASDSVRKLELFMAQWIQQGNNQQTFVRYTIQSVPKLEGS